MINQDFIDKHNSSPRPGVLGVISLGGSPGNYTLRAGITGPTIARGEPTDILAALGAILKVTPSEPLGDTLPDGRM